MKRIISLVLLSYLVCYAHAESFDVDTLLYHGDVDKFINIVILGDGYLESELEDFEEDAANVSAKLFDESPFTEYKNFFNVFMVKVPSNESGVAMDPDSLIDNYYGSTFNYAGIDRLLVPVNYSAVRQVLYDNMPQYDQVLMIVNSEKYGGSGGWIATSSIHGSAVEISLHELGHAFGGLIDEYWAGDQYAREGINMTQETDPEKVVWKEWYGDFDIGIYPHSESPTWHRPHQNCKMRYLGKPFCAVCTEALIDKVYKLVSPIVDYYPIESDIAYTSLPDSFNVDLIAPLPDTQEKLWILNGDTLARGERSFTLLEDSLQNGDNVLQFSVKDTTSLLRIDGRSTIHISVIEWTIDYASGLGITIEDKISDYHVNIYPVPSKDRIFVNLETEEASEYKIDILDLNGKFVKSIQVGYDEIPSADVSDLESGVYFIRIYSEGRAVLTEKFIKD